jgi:hypothetical protein
MSRLVVTAGRRGGKRLWPLAKTHGGHLRLTKPGRPIVHTSSTPSDWRAVRNAVSMLARADGYRVLEVERG